MINSNLHRISSQKSGIWSSIKFLWSFIEIPYRVLWNYIEVIWSSIEKLYGPSYANFPWRYLMEISMDFSTRIVKNNKENNSFE
jgi:hypothetical protein